MGFWYLILNQGMCGFRGLFFKSNLPLTLILDELEEEKIYSI